MQLTTTADTRLIVGWEVINSGSDRGQLNPMVEQLQAHYGQRPREYLADGGFATTVDIGQLAAQEITVFAPVIPSSSPAGDSGCPPQHSPIPRRDALTLKSSCSTKNSQPRSVPTTNLG